MTATTTMSFRLLRQRSLCLPPRSTYAYGHVPPPPSNSNPFGIVHRWKSSRGRGGGNNNNNYKRGGGVPKLVEQELSNALASAGPTGMRSDILYRSIQKRLGTDATRFKRQFGVKFSQWIQSLPYLQVRPAIDPSSESSSRTNNKTRVYHVISNHAVRPRTSPTTTSYGGSGGGGVLQDDYNDATSRILQAKTENQANYIEILKSSTPIIVVDGPAGTGKTALACQQAVELWRKGQYDKIVVTRPAVTADEELGYLPGDMQEKLRPYLLPIYDSLERVGLGYDQIPVLLENGLIEVAPLSFMRGRTFINSFIIAGKCTCELLRPLQRIA